MKFKIEKTRRELIKIVKNSDLQDKYVIRKSQELDKLLCDYIKGKN